MTRTCLCRSTVGNNVWYRSSASCSHDAANESAKDTDGDGSTAAMMATIFASLAARSSAGAMALSLSCPAEVTGCTCDRRASAR